MGCLICEDDSAVFVPKGDPSARHEGAILSPDPDWYNEQGQPKECSRVRVRALTGEEALSVPDGIEGIKRACELCLIDINGKAPKFSAGTRDMWQIGIGLLVMAVTQSPLTDRCFRFWQTMPPMAPSQDKSADGDGQISAP